MLLWLNIKIHFEFTYFLNLQKLRVLVFREPKFFRFLDSDNFLVKRNLISWLCFCKVNWTSVCETTKVLNLRFFEVSFVNKLHVGQVFLYRFKLNREYGVFNVVGLLYLFYLIKFLFSFALAEAWLIYAWRWVWRSRFDLSKITSVCFAFKNRLTLSDVEVLLD